MARKGRSTPTTGGGQKERRRTIFPQQHATAVTTAATEATITISKFAIPYICGLQMPIVSIRKHFGHTHVYAIAVKRSSNSRNSFFRKVGLAAGTFYEVIEGPPPPHTKEGLS